MEDVAAATLSALLAVPATAASVSIARVVVRGRVDEPKTLEELALRGKVLFISSNYCTSTYDIEDLEPLIWRIVLETCKCIVAHDRTSNYEMKRIMLF